MSVSRAFAIPKTAVTNVIMVNTLSYAAEIPGSNKQTPIPFTAVNGVLDIAIQDEVLLDLLTPGSLPRGFSSQPEFQASIMGGLSPVSSLGPNMLTFLKNFIANEYATPADYNLVTDIEIYNAPTMTKIRINYIENEESYQFDTVAPVKTTTDPVSGSSSNNYKVVSIFKSPLVVSFKYNGSDTRYLTLTSSCDSQ
jgi:hypothetical protein